jgi:hypothetical protein
MYHYLSFGAIWNRILKEWFWEFSEYEAVVVRRRNGFDRLVLLVQYVES